MIFTGINLIFPQVGGSWSISTTHEPLTGGWLKLLSRTVGQAGPSKCHAMILPLTPACKNAKY
jgi:hypothetical protein